MLRAIDLRRVRSLGYAFQVELTYRAVQAGFRVVEVPITFRDRAARHVEDVAARSPARRCVLVPRLRRRGGRRARAARPPAPPPQGGERGEAAEPAEAPR